MTRRQLLQMRRRLARHGYNHQAELTRVRQWLVQHSRRRP